MKTNGKFKKNKDADGHDIAGGTILWNSTLALEDNNGTSMSPTTIINHEFGHAAGYDWDPIAYAARAGTPDKQYGDAEERQVITGVEQRTARALGRNWL